jgi:hypothetical protein
MSRSLNAKGPTWIFKERSSSDIEQGGMIPLLLLISPLENYRTDALLDSNPEFPRNTLCQHYT